MNYKMGDLATCESCGKEIQYIGPEWRHTGTQPRHPGFPKTYIVRYWEIPGSWPFSIDKKPKDARSATIEVMKEETFVKNGKRYYRMVSGLGVWEDLLIEENP